VRFGCLAIEQHNDHYVFQVQVYLNELDPEAVKIELYADAQNGGETVRQPMQRGGPTGWLGQCLPLCRQRPGYAACKRLHPTRSSS
jgi:hypothetical protein